MAKLKKALAKDPYQPEAIIDENGETTQTNEEALEVLMRKHFPGISTSSVGKMKVKSNKRRPSRNDWTLAKKLITPEKVKWAIKTFKPFKSPGIDGIIPALIIESGDILTSNLVNLFRASLAFAYVPKAWQEVKVIFIPKPGKTSYAVADAYRPISLTSILLKIMERFLDRYIRDGPLTAKPLHHKQHAAYTAGKSVDSAIHNLVRKIEKAFHAKEHALGTFLDVVGAFNLICYDCIKKQRDTSVLTKL